MKHSSKAEVSQYDSLDEAYRLGFEHGKIDRSNLKANIAFLETSGLLCPGKRILEIGCGAGNLAGYLHDKGLNITAVDISSVALKKAVELHSNLSFCQMVAEELGFKDDSFDVVLSFDFFEHIPSIADHLDEVKRVLKAGGYYLFETPNKLTNIPFEVLKTKKLNYRSYHPSLQTLTSLKRLMKKHDFETEVVQMPVLNKFTTEKIKAVFGCFITKAITKINFSRLPLFLYPSFYIISNISK